MSLLLKNAEDYSYFHLVPTSPNPTTVFGISCNRQIKSTELLAKDEDVTRSTVQKAVVVLATKPLFGPIRYVRSPILAFPAYMVAEYAKEISLESLLGRCSSRGEPKCSCPTFGTPTDQHGVYIETFEI